MATAKHTIEIFSAGCSTCKETIDLVKKVAGADHHVQVHDMQHGDTAARAKKRSASGVCRRSSSTASWRDAAPAAGRTST